MSSAYNYIPDASYQSRGLQTYPNQVRVSDPLNMNMNKNNVYQNTPSPSKKGQTKREIIIPDNYLSAEHYQKMYPLNYSTPIGNNNYSSFNYTNGINTSDLQFLQFAKDHKFINTKAPPPPPRPSNSFGTQQRDGNKQNSFVSQKFPLSFNPRVSPNMSHKEKVNRWIGDVPVYLIAKGQTSLSDIWHTECYPAVIPITSGFSEFYDDEEVGDSYFPESGVLDNTQFVDQNDVLEFQSRKITEFARKIYQLDRGDKVRLGKKPNDCDTRKVNFSFEHDFYLKNLQKNYQDSFNIRTQQPLRQADLELEFLKGDFTYDTERKFKRPGNF